MRATSHSMNFDSTKVLTDIQDGRSRIITEVIDTEKRPNIQNIRDETQCLLTKLVLNRTNKEALELGAPRIIGSIIPPLNQNQQRVAYKTVPLS